MADPATSLASPLDVRRHGGVLVLTMNDPATRNALSPTVFAAGTRALSEAADDDSLGAVVLTGANGAFCSGGDLRLLAGAPSDITALLDSFHGFVRAIRALPLPVIAAVEGSAAGAGFSLALGCDLLVASREASFLMAYIKVGLTPDGGATAFLARALPRALQTEIVLTGAPVSAERLHGLGVVNRLVDPGAAFDTALAWATAFAAGPRAAVGRAKRLVEAAGSNGLEDQLDLEAALFSQAIAHGEAREGMTAFLHKRSPDFATARARSGQRT
ncbi:enoyl-CoA hydratase [Rhodospirillum rubrum]|uniref:oxepin-CoA hydrolase, alternative type n=1 Tax=Rhodospirillum rubrum TaxID=1085 RepID=UPI0019076C4D|nr:enoyl-CoA hydratase [Rhodospirillum rubrum]MBK1664580.1 enoyl-CoA hydratase [Rhodospirillum rubrum]MBK1676751.1 enoyl-CoA hydratase [Rhodospirillum rubrum]